MLPSIVTIPNDFVFLIEVIKSMFYFSMYFETFEVKLGLIHSAGLTIVSKEVVIEGKSKYITKHLIPSKQKLFPLGPYIKCILHCLCL